MTRLSLWSCAAAVQLWEVDGLAGIAEAERETGLPLAVEDFEADVDTIGGLVVGPSRPCARRPAISIEHPRGPIMEVIAADPRRVIRIRLRAPKAASASACRGQERRCRPV